MLNNLNNNLLYSTANNNINVKDYNSVQTTRKPKINYFEYIFKINNNFDQNRIFNYISEMQLKLENEKETKKSKEN